MLSKLKREGRYNNFWLFRKYCKQACTFSVGRERPKTSFGKRLSQGVTGGDYKNQIDNNKSIILSINNFQLR